MVTILQKDAPVLREKAKSVPESMFGTKKLSQIIADMKTAIASQDDAVAIAAPQIGIPYRIFVVAGRAIDMTMDEPEDATESTPKSDDQIFINPEIVKLSRDREEMEEGCLSVRYLYGRVSRATKARVRAQDEEGVWFEAGGSGLVAQIFQHEIDHLDGVLFIDKATDLHDAPPEE
ncbi:MAG TPA: peptide deformylase [Candidatus Paceibacterota bacterium]|jgi:peptide deformylase